MGLVVEVVEKKEVLELVVIRVKEVLHLALIPAYDSSGWPGGPKEILVAPGFHFCYFSSFFFLILIIIYLIFQTSHFRSGTIYYSIKLEYCLE